MKNKEKYVDDIIAIASNGYNIAVRRVYEQVVGCEATDCRDCVFLGGNCAENRQKWFESEAAPTIDELKSELETLKKERDELRARLDKAVELPCKLGGDVYSVRWSKDNPKDGVAERALSWLCGETMRDIRIIMYPSIGKQVRDKQELYDFCMEQAEKELAEEKGE